MTSSDSISKSQAVGNSKEKIIRTILQQMRERNYKLRETQKDILTSYIHRLSLSPNLKKLFLNKELWDNVGNLNVD